MHAIYQSQHDTYLEAMPNTTPYYIGKWTYLDFVWLQYFLQAYHSPNIMYKWSIEKNYAKLLLHKTKANVDIDHGPQKKKSQMHFYTQYFLVMQDHGT